MHLPVASYMGAWIETQALEKLARVSMSHPTWVRGLKPRTLRSMLTSLVVASSMGAWIETVLQGIDKVCRCVASYMGAWIET